MRHASEANLKPIAALLAQLRALSGITEKKPGIFYKKATAFLHFHEDSGKLFADIKQEGEFVRYEVGASASQAKLLKLAQSLLKS
ncbi:MAG: hypothetical protein RL341_1949 [Pseudomonadota bacterium]|jgi:hypothetical protein